MKTTMTTTLLALLLACQARADIHVVRPDGLGTIPDIQTAVNASADGDEIWLMSGVFTGPGNRDVEIGPRNILIKSFDDDASACVIDCGPAGPGNEHRAFRLAYAACQTTTFRAITFRNGYAEPGGGAMLFVGGASASLANCVFENNATGMTEWHGGGAVYVDRGGVPVFYGCEFRGNEAFAGGALTTNHGGHVTFYACRFVGNRAVRGGAVYGITADKFACIFSGNEAAVGGAVWGNAVGVDYYERCTLDGNRAASGGAIFVMANYGGSVELVDTIVSNSLEGPGLTISPAVPITLSCSNLYGNAGGDWIAPFAAQVDERGNFSANPCYCDPDGGDFRLSADSYARAGGHPWGCEQQVGVYGVGCGESGCSGPVAVEGVNFGTLKSMYR
jgi:hypothetical protein